MDSIAGPSSQPYADTKTESIDWEKCVICQTPKGEVLKCPGSSIRSEDGAGYKTLAENLLGFKKIGCLPLSMVRWVNDENVEQNLRSHNAKWHDSCRLLYNKTKLKRAMKRVAVCMPEDSNAPAKKYTRRNSIKSSAIEQCFFCGVSANMSEPLHQVSTLGLDARVRQCALQLQDQGLLAKMSAGLILLHRIAKSTAISATCIMTSEVLLNVFIIYPTQP